VKSPVDLGHHLSLDILKMMAHWAGGPAAMGAQRTHAEPSGDRTTNSQFKHKTIIVRKSATAPKTSIISKTNTVPKADYRFHILK
jgi:hypothetical protein